MSRKFGFSAFREVFDLIDANGGGTIDAEELEDVLLGRVGTRLANNGT